MPGKSVSAGRDEDLPAANSSRPSPPPSPPQRSSDAKKRSSGRKDKSKLES
ncbi:hypothetical protein OROMI_024564 [Orobanche minor]